MPNHETLAVRIARPFPIVLLVLVVLTSLSACGHSKSEAGGGKEQDAVVSEKFSGGSLPGDWKVDREGVWSIQDGKLRGVLPNKKQDKSVVRIGSNQWTNYTVELDVCQVRGVDKGLAVRVNDDEGVGIDLRGGEYGDILMYRGFSQLGKAGAPNRKGAWNHLRVEVNGGRYRVYVDRKLKIDYTDEKNERPSGGIALPAYTGGSGECEVLYDNLVVRPLK